MASVPRVCCARRRARSILGVPQDEWTRVLLVRSSVLVRRPPSPNNGATARKHDTLIRPERELVDVVVAVRPVLNHRHSLPARDAVLGGKRAQPAITSPLAGGIATFLALHAEGTRVRAWGIVLLVGAGLGALLGAVLVESLEEHTGGACGRGVVSAQLESEILNGSAAVGAGELVHNVVARVVLAYFAHFVGREEGGDALPLLAERRHLMLREMSVPELGILGCLEGVHVGEEGALSLAGHVVLPEVGLVEDPTHVDGPTVAAHEDWLFVG